MTPWNEHVRLAQAMLHGHLYIDPAPPWMEHIHVNGHDYILHPPLSAILCVPFALFGVSNEAIPSVCLGIIAAVLVCLLARSGWLTAFFVLGTTFLYEATLGASWDFALVASTPFTLAALCEVNRDDGNDWLVGLWAGLAALARYDLVLAFPVYLFVRRDFRVLGGLILWGTIYIWFNEARFGTLTDGSVQEWYWHYDKFRAARPYGPFSMHYLPFNLYTLLYMGPSLQDRFPWLRPQHMGQAILSLSPGFLLVRWNPWLIAAALASLPALTVYANGFTQLGCRYYVQVFPFMVASMAKPETPRAKALILASVGLSMSATLIVWTYGLM